MLRIKRQFWYIFRKSDGKCAMIFKGAKPSDEAMKSLDYVAVGTTEDLGRPRDVMLVGGEIRRVVRV